MCEHKCFYCVFLRSPMARLNSFCTRELTPTILYKPCSSIPEKMSKKKSLRLFIPPPPRHHFTRAKAWTQIAAEELYRLHNRWNKLFKAGKWQRISVYVADCTSSLHGVNKFFHHVEASHIKLGHWERGREEGRENRISEKQSIKYNTNYTA